MQILSREEFLKLYYYMVLSREFENKANQLYQDGKIQYKPLSGVGQEAVSVGATISLRKEDYVLPSLRTKGAFLTKGLTVKEWFLEHFMKEDSLSKGYWSHHHVGDMEKGIILSSAIVASSLSVAVGVAFSAKMKKKDQVVVAFFGDGGSSRGDFHTSLNFAAVHDLPIIFVCENNLYALSTPISEQMKNPDIVDRARGYGIAGEKVDGQDVLEVYYATEKAIKRARKGYGPTLLECKTYRYRGHTETHHPDDGRPEDELKYWKEKCPIRLYQDYLMGNGDFKEEEFVEIERDIKNEIEKAAEEAENSPDTLIKEINDIMKYVYA